jgi:hypothetical protein
VTLLFKATDQLGQVATKSTTVNVYTNPQLSQVTTVPGTVFDVRGTRVLYWVNTGTQLLVKLQDGAATTTLSVHNPKSTAMRGALTASGAFLAVDTASGAFLLREYVNGATQTVSAYTGTNVGWAFAGEWAAWSDANRTVYRRSIGSATVNTGLSAATLLDINALGDVAAITSGQAGISSATVSGTKRTLDSDIAGIFDDVHIDNVRTMWSFIGPCCISKGVQLRMVVGAGALQNVTPYLNINTGKAPCCTQTVNGWYGYAKPSATGELQVFVVDPTGVSTQVSKFFADSKLEALGANGEALFVSGGIRYYSLSPYTSVTALGSVRGSPIYRDGKFLIVLSNTVYRVP